MSESARHRDLIDLVRFRAREHLYAMGYAPDDFYVTPGDEGAIPGKSMRPDVWFLGPCQTIPVEVGQMQPGKWGSKTPVVRVYFDGGVATINKSGTKFERDLEAAIMTAVHSDEPAVREPFWWKR